MPTFIVREQICFHLANFYFFFIFYFLEICCSTHLCIHWLILVRALTWDQTRNVGVWGRCSNQLSYMARADFYFKKD